MVPILKRPSGYKKNSEIIGVPIGDDAGESVTLAPLSIVDYILTKLR